MNQTDLHKSAYNTAVNYCVLGSAAEIERVWSMAGHVLTEHHSSLSPLIFELIMYLKYNTQLWELQDVVNVNISRKKETEAAQRQDATEKQRCNKDGDEERASSGLIPVWHCYTVYQCRNW